MRMPSPPIARIGMGAAALVGAFASAYLLDVYLTGGPIVCGAAQSGCDAVRASGYAYVFGLIPRPALGLLFYGMIFCLLVTRSATQAHALRLRQLSYFLAAFGVFESGYLILIQALVIEAFCLWCLMSGAATFFIGGLAILDRPERHHEMSSFREMRAYLVMFLIYAPLASGLFWWLTRIAH